MAAKGKRYLGQEHQLPAESLAAIARNEKGKAFGIDSRKVDRQIKNLCRLIKKGREAYEQRSGKKVIIEPPTPFLPDADI